MQRLLSLLALTIAGCGGGVPDANDMAPTAFVPPVTAAPKAVEGQRNTTPLTAYVGRYPRDAVDGVSFFDRTEVANALVETVPDAATRAVMIGREAVQVPIFRRGDRIAAHGCEPHDCADRNWTVLIAASGNVEGAAVCRHEADTMGDTSQWMTRRGGERRPGGCPQA